MCFIHSSSQDASGNPGLMLRRKYLRSLCTLCTYDRLKPLNMENLKESGILACPISCISRR